MLRSRTADRSLALAAGAILVAATGIAAAPAASASSAPAVSLEPPSVSGASATLSFTVNRAAHSIARADCSVTDAAEVVTQVSCGEARPGPVRRSTVYETTLTGLAAGDHAYAVTITLTDGGTATGTTSFTVEPPTPVEFATTAATCQALPGGTFVVHAMWWLVWSCDFDAPTADAGAAASAALGPLCLADGGIGSGGGLVSPGRYEVSCWLT